MEKPDQRSPGEVRCSWKKLFSDSLPILSDGRVSPDAQIGRKYGMGASSRRCAWS